MNQSITLAYDSRYNTYSIPAIFHLLHHSEDYSKLWISKFPDTQVQAENFFKNENCGCRPVLLQKYYKHRVDVDLFTVYFIHENPNCVNFDDLCKNVGGQDLRGTIFSVNNSIGDFKDFLSSLQQKKASFNHFNTVTIGDKILVNFF